MIGRSGERGSGISVLAARHDDDDGIRAGIDNPKASGEPFLLAFICLQDKVYC